MPEPRWWIHSTDKYNPEEEFTFNKGEAMKVASKMLKDHEAIQIQRNPFTTR